MSIYLSPHDFAEALSQTIKHGIFYMSFKDGVFQNQIPNATPYTFDMSIAALKTMLDSELLKPCEIYSLEYAQDMLDRLMKTYGHGKAEADVNATNQDDVPGKGKAKAVVDTTNQVGVPGIASKMLGEGEQKDMANAIESVQQMFEKDRQERGIRNPSYGYMLVAKSVNKRQRSILQTILFDRDGYKMIFEGNLFDPVKLRYNIDYVNAAVSVGPGGETIRCLTPSFMVAQDLQAPGLRVDEDLRNKHISKCTLPGVANFRAQASEAKPNSESSERNGPFSPLPSPFSPLNASSSSFSSARAPPLNASSSSSAPAPAPAPPPNASSSSSASGPGLGKNAKSTEVPFGGNANFNGELTLPRFESSQLDEEEREFRELAARIAKGQPQAGEPSSSTTSYYGGDEFDDLFF